MKPRSGKGTGSNERLSRLENDFGVQVQKIGQELLTACRVIPSYALLALGLTE